MKSQMIHRENEGKSIKERENSRWMQQKVG